MQALERIDPDRGRAIVKVTDQALNDNGDPKPLVEIAEVAETRPEWADHAFHYDLRFTINDKRVYIETRLHYREPFAADESWILVVNIHEP